MSLISDLSSASDLGGETCGLSTGGKIAATATVLGGDTDRVSEELLDWLLLSRISAIEIPPVLFCLVWCDLALQSPQLHFVFCLGALILGEWHMWWYASSHTEQVINGPCPTYSISKTTNNQLYVYIVFHLQRLKFHSRRHNFCNARIAIQSLSWPTALRQCICKWGELQQIETVIERDQINDCIL